MRYNARTVELICEKIRGGQLPADFPGKDRDRKLPAIGTFRSWKRKNSEMRHALDAAYQESSEHLLVELRDLRVELRGEVDQGAIKSVEVRQKQVMWLLERFDKARFGQRVAVEHESRWDELVKRLHAGRARVAKAKLDREQALPPARVLPFPKSDAIDAEIVGSPLPPAKRTGQIRVDV